VTIVEAALLGIVQGLTEFLPVSSSAHLILARAFFGWSAGSGESGLDLAFDVFCHVGTLVAVLAFFRTEVVQLVFAVPGALRGGGGLHGRRLWLIAAGTVPVAVVGLLWSDAIDAVRSPVVAAVALLVGAVLLLVIERLGAQGHGDERLTLAGAFGIGVAQAAALVPGVSRSGATIAMGMALGLRRAAAARFTFLLSVPAILAAAAKKTIDLRGVTIEPGVMDILIVGMLTSAVVGYVTVKYFIRFLEGHRLDVFAWYRVALAAATFVWLAR
jgi:undecaprenyl-diphosphatase